MPVEPSAPDLEELISHLEPAGHGVAAGQPDAAAPATEPDPLLLLESLLAGPAPAVAGEVPQWEAPLAPQVPAAPVAAFPGEGPPETPEPPDVPMPGIVEPMGAVSVPASAAAGAARPVARDVQQVPAYPDYHMVAPIELWFADGPPRVGIRPGTPTYLKYQRLAQVLLNDLKKARAEG
jgi:hypothetical protein